MSGQVQSFKAVLVNVIYAVIYHPIANWIIRNVTTMLIAILPRKMQINPSGTIRVKIPPYGSIKMNANQTSYVTRELFWKGADEYEYSPIFIKIINSFDHFLDIGSNIGYYSVLAAAINKKIKVDTFEPSPGSVTFVKKNLKINGLDKRVNVHTLALSDQKGNIDFFEVKNEKYPDVINLSGEHNLGTKPHLLSRKTEVPSDTLDNFLKEKGIECIDLIKIDTEGCEDVILEHGQDVIARCKPIIICETLFNRIEIKLEQLMKKHGYEFYNYKDGALYQVDSLKRDVDDGIRDCFFVHPSKKHIVAPFVRG